MPFHIGTHILSYIINNRLLARFSHILLRIEGTVYADIHS